MYPPGYESVPFDYGSAEAAAQACRRTANSLHDATGRRHDLAVAARAEWRGTFREHFDMTLSGIEADAGALEIELRQLAGAIDDASAAARLENQRRTDLRTQYRHDHPEEFTPVGGGLVRVS